MQTASSSASEVLTTPEAAVHIGMSCSYLRRDRVRHSKEGKIPGPPFIKLDRAVRYLKSDLDDWLDNLRVVRG